jgi:hypothetical protein
MKPRRLVIGCSILRSELAEVIREQDELEVETRWLKAGYHVRPELLERALEGALESIGPYGRQEVRVFIGERCLLEPPAILKGLKILPAANCLTAIVGLERLRELEAGPSMVVTPAWIREIYFARDPELPIWDESEFRMNLGRYERLVVLDTGRPLTDEETLAAFDLTGRVIEAESVDLGPFKRLMMEFLR